MDTSSRHAPDSGRDRGENIGDVLVSARSLAEYRAMFALTDHDLRGRVLDCPGGGAGFTAAARAEGAEAVAVDPTYDEDVEDLVTRVMGEVERGQAWAEENAERYDWAFYGGLDGHTRMRRASAQLFADDLRAHPERYVPGSLPDLPFADAGFDLVLSSHLLFSYADRLDRAFHRTALLEMLRVCRGEVRVYPLVHHAGHALPDLVDQVLSDMRDADVTAEVREVDFAFQKEAGQMLVVRRGGGPAPSGRSGS